MVVVVWLIGLTKFQTCRQTYYVHYTTLHKTRNYDHGGPTWANLNSTNENAEQAHVSLDSTDEIYRCKFYM